MLKLVRFLELMWLVVAAISGVIGTIHLFKTTPKDALFFYFLAAIAIALYFLRKKNRIKLEQENNSETS